MTSRREFLASVAGAGIMAAVSPALARAARASATPRKFVHIMLPGGIDSLYWVDPKTPGEVDARVEMPYPESQIVETDSGIRLAPHASALARYGDRIAVVNGVNCSTIAHEVGQVQMRFLTRDYITSSDRSIACEVGEHLGSARGVHEVQLGRSIFVLNRGTGGRAVYGGATGEVIRQFIALKEQDERLFEAAIAELGRQAKATRESAVRDSIEVELALLEKLPGTIPAGTPLGVDQLYAPELLTKPLRVEYGPMTANMVKMFDQAAWLLANDLTPAVSLVFNCRWDTHADNHMIQANSASLTAQALANFLEQLEGLPGSQGGNLLDETAIVVSSELGRYPFINGRLGKDHYPVMPVVFIGPAIRAGRYGATDKLLAPERVSRSKGTASSAGEELVIDDVGASIRHWFGIPQPEALRGTVLQFRFA